METKRRRKAPGTCWSRIDCISRGRGYALHQGCAVLYSSHCATETNNEASCGNAFQRGPPKRKGTYDFPGAEWWCYAFQSLINVLFRLKHEKALTKPRPRMHPSGKFGGTSSLEETSSSSHSGLRKKSTANPDITSTSSLIFDDSETQILPRWSFAWCRITVLLERYKSSWLLHIFPFICWYKMSNKAYNMQAVADF